MTAGVPEMPDSGVGPAAASVQSAGVAVAPVVPLSTTFTSVRVGPTAVLVIVQVARSPAASVTAGAGVPPTQLQAEAW